MIRIKNFRVIGKKCGVFGETMEQDSQPQSDSGKPSKEGLAMLYSHCIQQGWDAPDFNRGYSEIVERTL